LCDYRKKLVDAKNDWKQKINDVFPSHQRSEKLISLLSDYNPTNKPEIIKIWKGLTPIPEKSFHIFFVLDASGSMGFNSGGKNSMTRWSALVEAVNAFVNLRKQKDARDLISIVEYDHRAHVQCSAQPLSFDFNSVLNFYGGGTNFSEGLKAIKELIDKNNHDVYTPVLLFLSDGECDNGEKEMTDIHNSHCFNQIAVFTMGFCDAGTAKLQQLANLAGGSFVNSSDGIKLKENFINVANNLKGRKGN